MTIYLFHPRDPWSVAMKVNWPMVRKVTMVVRFFKARPIGPGGLLLVSIPQPICCPSFSLLGGVERKVNN